MSTKVRDQAVVELVLRHSTGGFVENAVAIRHGGTSVAGRTFRKIVSGCCVCALLAVSVSAQGEGASGFFRRSSGESGDGSYDHRQAAIANLPTQRLTRQAQQRITAITDSPTIYRRLPTQAIDCDKNMFLFLSRNPEVLVGMWDLMGITDVQIKRVGPYQLEAQDGNGTTCTVDLVYGDPNTHIFVANGSYDGKIVAKPISGRGVFILTSAYAISAEGRTTVTGTIDCFLQLDSLGADLIARTMSGLIGRSADNNFVETARFMAQVSQASERNPVAMLDVAARLPQVMPATKQRFADQVNAVARQADDDARYARVP